MPESPAPMTIASLDAMASIVLLRGMELAQERGLESPGPARHESAVHRYRLPCDIARRVAGEPQHRGRDFLRLAHALDRLVVLQPWPDAGHALCPALVRHAGVDRRLDRAGADRVDANAGLGELQRHRLRHADHCRLAGT